MIRPRPAPCVRTEHCKATDYKAPPIVDFAGSDSLLKDAEYDAYPDLQMYPTVAGAVVPIYNLPTRDAGDPALVLRPATVSRIFRGNITFWDDPEILELNPELVRPPTLPAHLWALARAALSSSSFTAVRQRLTSYRRSRSRCVFARTSAAAGVEERCLIFAAAPLRPWAHQPKS